MTASIGRIVAERTYEMPSLADVSERLMQQYEKRLLLDLVSEVVRGVAAERGTRGQPTAGAEVERIARTRLDRLLGARVPPGRRPS